MSPIDLIPHPIPLLGHLDDAVIVPLGIYLAFKVIPVSVLQECRRRAETAAAPDLPRSRVGAALVIVAWALVALIVLRLVGGPLQALMSAPGR